MLFVASMHTQGSVVHVNECCSRDYTAIKRITTLEVARHYCNGSDYRRRIRYLLQLEKFVIITT